MKKAHTLLELKENEKATVTAVSGGPELAAKLSAMGIHPGRRLIKRSSKSYNGPVTIEVMGAKIAIGRAVASHILLESEPETILLIGNPNVGKSVVFSRLTGLDVISANYPGTTINYTQGAAYLGKEHFLLIDVPGTYSLSPSNKAEEAARDIILNSEPALLIITIDATNLERNLYFALEALELGKPAVILLNKSDIAKNKGIKINTAELGKKLGVTAIPFVATTGEGLRALNESILNIKNIRVQQSRQKLSSDDKWRLIGNIAASCQTITHKHPTFLEKMETFTASPATGIPFAIASLVLTFITIRSFGEFLINYLLEPAFSSLYLPLLNKLNIHAALRSLLLGTTGDPMASFGLLTTGVYIPFVTVLPYLTIFYLVLGFLEDTGYLPRLSVLLDNMMHKLGLHGYGAIPLMLGLGCKVPAILALRNLETRRERIIAASFTLAAAPCMPQTAMILAILSPYPLRYTLAVFATLAITGACAGWLLKNSIKGETPELFLEIPPYQIPALSVLIKKTWLRLKEFLFEAVPMIMLGVLAISALENLGVIVKISAAFSYPVTHWLKLPADTISVMVLGFLRKDVSIAMLKSYLLTPGQLVTASVFLTMYLPCLGSLTVTLRELGLRDSCIVIVLNFFAALLAASLLAALI